MVAITVTERKAMPSTTLHSSGRVLGAARLGTCCGASVSLVR